MSDDRLAPGLGDWAELDARAAGHRRALARVHRHAGEWSAAGEPVRLLARGRALSQAWALADELDPLAARYLAASSRWRRRARAVALGLPSLALALGLAWAWAWAGVGAGARSGSAAAPGPAEALADPVAPEASVTDRPAPAHARAPRQTVEHVVIPAETLEDIALRYAVPLPLLRRWNGVDEHTPLVPGQRLRVETHDPPLPQQRVVYRPDAPESWTSLAQRFDVSVAKLRAYNPGFAGEPGPGDELIVWVDPKPLVRDPNVALPRFEVRPDAISVGSPRDGRLLDGIQFPAEDALYKRRKPYIMWCSSHVAKHLREAIAAFRYQYGFEGELVVADMSQRGGGPFPPHRSHQAGRDVDIWLPTLAGVYQRNHLERDLRPEPDEADWYALYGLLQALAQTGAVEQVFLDYSLHDRVYQAAKRMGASEAELDAMIAYPRGRGYRKALLQHSDAHTHHIHVRFGCGPHDQCSRGVDDDPGD